MHTEGLSCCVVFLLLGLCSVHSRNVLLMVGECRRPWLAVHGRLLLPPEAATRLLPSYGLC